jgi:hypothetical protein
VLAGEAEGCGKLELDDVGTGCLKWLDVYDVGVEEIAAIAEG